MQPKDVPPQNNPEFDPEKPDAGKKKPDTISFRSMRTEKKPPVTYDAVLDYIKGNTKDTIAYVLMIVGLLLMLFDSLYGSLIIGVLFGLYFVNELAFFALHVKEFVEEYGLVKSLIMAGTLLALFIKVPLLFLGAGVVIALRIFLWPEENKL